MSYKPMERSTVLDQSRSRLAGMYSIDLAFNQTIDYGGFPTPLTKAEFEQAINDAEALQLAYNQKLDEADALRNQFKRLEQQISSDYSRILKSAVGKFGSDADAIGQLGGTRKSNRKKVTRKKKDDTTTPVI